MSGPLPAIGCSLKTNVCATLPELNGSAAITRLPAFKPGCHTFDNAVDDSVPPVARSSLSLFMNVGTSNGAVRKPADAAESKCGTVPLFVRPPSTMKRKPLQSVPVSLVMVSSSIEILATAFEETWRNEGGGLLD
jgi:hypothetical protein